MAYLKKKEWARAEHDASVALALDSAHVKSYQRRASARASMGKLQAALRDLHLKDTVVAANSTTNDQGDGNKRNTGKTRSSEKMKIESMLRSAIHNAPRRRIPVAVLNGKELDADCGEDNKKQQLDSAVWSEKMALYPVRALLQIIHQMKRLVMLHVSQQSNTTNGTISPRHGTSLKRSGDRLIHLHRRANTWKVA